MKKEKEAAVNKLADEVKEVAKENHKEKVCLGERDSHFSSSFTHPFRHPFRHPFPHPFCFRCYQIRARFYPYFIDFPFYRRSFCRRSPRTVKVARSASRRMHSVSRRLNNSVCKRLVSEYFRFHFSFLIMLSLWLLNSFSYLFVFFLTSRLLRRRKNRRRLNASADKSARPGSARLRRNRTDWHVPDQKPPLTKRKSNASWKRWSSSARRRWRKSSSHVRKSRVTHAPMQRESVARRRPKQRPSERCRNPPRSPPVSLQPLRPPGPLHRYVNQRIAFTFPVLSCLLCSLDWSGTKDSAGRQENQTPKELTGLSEGKRTRTR